MKNLSLYCATICLCAASIALYSKTPVKNELSSQALSLKALAQTAYTENTQSSIDDGLSRQLETFLRPVHLDEEGLQRYFDVYNHEKYGTEFLPACFVHINDLLEQTASIRMPVPYVYSVVSLFHQKLKESLWINPFAFDFAVKSLITTTREIINTQQTSSKNILQTIIVEHCTNSMEQWYTNKNLFADELAAKICACNYADTSRENNRLRDMIVRFMESAFDKLVWNPRDEVATWESFKHLGELTLQMRRDNIIKSDDAINMLLWSLVSRYSHFLDNTGTMMGKQTIDTIYQECSRNKDQGLHEPLGVPEREDLMTTKQEFLLKHINKLHIKAIAYEKEGLLLD